VHTCTSPRASRPTTQDTQRDTQLEAHTRTLASRLDSIRRQRSVGGCLLTSNTRMRCNSRQCRPWPRAGHGAPLTQARPSALLAARGGRGGLTAWSAHTSSSECAVRGRRWAWAASVVGSLASSTPIASSSGSSTSLSMQHAREKRVWRLRALARSVARLVCRLSTWRRSCSSSACDATGSEG
jgi:hypothetical protein